MAGVRVAITGLGLLTPLGADVGTTWSALLAGRSGVGPITRFDPSRLPVGIAAEVKDFRPREHTGSDDVEEMSLSTQYAVAAARQALEDAGLGIFNGDGHRVGVVIGVGLGLHPDFAYLSDPSVLPSARGGNSRFIPKVLGNMAAAQISVRWKAKGPSLCISTSCCSGLQSIGEALRLIQEGRADVMIAGGTEACIIELAMGGFCSMRCLSTRGGDPGRALRPFDARRDGFVLGEGAGVVVLERWDRAVSRGARIYAEPRGYGMSAGADHITLPDPTGESQAMCMENAVREAGLDPSEVDYVNAHGSATVTNDKTESLAIKRAFGDHAYRLAVSSTKSMTGHLLGAAGAVETIFSVLALRDQVLPPTINYENFDPDCDLDYVPNAARPASVRHVLTNSFAFGGTNASLLLSAPERP